MATVDPFAVAPMFMGPVRKTIQPNMQNLYLLRRKLQNVE